MDPTAFARTASTLGFVHNRLDRRANSRDDAALMAALRQRLDARVAIVIEDAVVLRPAPRGATPWFSSDEASSLGAAEETVFLGQDEVGPAFAMRLGDVDAAALSAWSDVVVLNLRAVAVEDRVSAADLGALAEAKALLHWHQHHRFCSSCGAPSQSSGAGWRRECTRCGTHHFPRTDPVVIMLAVDRDRCLMGRQARFPGAMYSCLAGFLEPGETVEAAVAREIGEEAGITVGRVTYLGAQPWPFPASLMIGCLAEATSTDITLDELELEDARWFTRDEARAMLAGRHPEGLTCPLPMAIAHHILRAWVDGAA